MHFGDYVRAVVGVTFEYLGDVNENRTLRTPPLFKRGLVARFDRLSSHFSVARASVKSSFAFANGKKIGNQISFT